MSLTVPLIDGPSSSPVTRKLIEPGKAPRLTKRKAAATAAASPPFMSQAPRPQSCAFGDLAGERAEPPARRVARRNDVGVPGEDQVRRRRSAAGVEVEDVRRSCLREGDELGGKTGAGEQIGEIGQRAGVRRRHRGKGDQRCGRCRARRADWPCRHRTGRVSSGDWSDLFAIRQARSFHLGRISRTGAAQSRPTS